MPHEIPPTPENKVHELNPRLDLVAMLEKIDGLDRDDARFLVRLDQKIGNGELGNVLFALRHILSTIADPEKHMEETQSFKDYEHRLYDKFHAKRAATGKTGPVMDDEILWGDHLAHILNLDKEAFSKHVDEKYASQLSKSEPERILKDASDDFIKAVGGLSTDEQGRLFTILGITATTGHTVVFSEQFINTTKASLQHSEFIKKIAVVFSEDYRETISNNPTLDQEAYALIEKTGQLNAIDADTAKVNFTQMPTDSIIKGLLANNMSDEMRQGALAAFLDLCRKDMPESSYALFERQARGLADKKNWESIVRLAYDTFEAHFASPQKDGTQKD